MHRHAVRWLAVAVRVRRGGQPGLTRLQGQVLLLGEQPISADWTSRTRRDVFPGRAGFFACFPPLRSFLLFIAYFVPPCAFTAPTLPTLLAGAACQRWSTRCGVARSRPGGAQPSTNLRLTSCAARGRRSCSCRRPMAPDEPSVPCPERRRVAAAWISRVAPAAQRKHARESETLRALLPGPGEHAPASPRPTTSACAGAWPAALRRRGAGTPRDGFNCRFSPG